MIETKELDDRFWASAREGTLRVQSCSFCTALRFFPQRRCPSCLADGGDWIDLSGNGTVYSVSEVHRAPTKQLAGEAPYMIALVELDEGVRVMARIAPGTLPEIGAPVRFAGLGDSGDGPYLIFAPAEPAE